MCGIVGILDRTASADTLEPQVRRMSDTLVHRGPDGSGHWVDGEAGIAFGHRRLAIIDLTEAGHQPMRSHCGRYVITYNGELYNADEIRSELIAQGVAFRGTSDTEVLVNAISVHGLVRTLKALNGIFAFAVWDTSDRVLSLARDHVGIKPLFYSRNNARLAFASEVRALAIMDGFDRTLDFAAVGSFLQHNYIRAPLTIYRDVRSLEPGHVLTIGADGSVTDESYWDICDIVTRQAGDRRAATDDADVIDGLESILTDAVRRQLVSDVPIGAFLSGGVDSSTVVALIQKVASRPVRTFSIGFEDDKLNEAVVARAVADHLKTDHTELYVQEQDALDCVPNIARLYDQPLADTSTIPTYLLCKMAREHVTVALSGDGGDELFYGYSRFEKAAGLHDRLRRLPGPMRRLAGGALDVFGGRNLRQGFPLSGASGERARWHAGRLLHLAGRNPSDAYLHLHTHWAEPEQIAPGAITDRLRWPESEGVTESLRERMMLHDARTYMTDDVLVKVDRASMAASLEARVPLLDPRVIAHAWSLPMSVKFRDGETKWALRQVLYRHVPRALIDRPKSGFGAPIGAWLRGPLREWAEDLLSERALGDQGLFNVAAVRRVWEAHLSGRVDVSSYLWSVVMLQAWMRETGQPPVQRSAQGVAA